MKSSFMMLLQAPRRKLVFLDRLDAVDGGGSRGQGGGEGNAVAGGRHADFLTIGVRLTPQRRVDDELNLARFNGVNGVR